MQINISHRLILRIIVSTHPRKLIRNRVNPRKPTDGRIVIPKAIRIQINPIVLTQLFAVVKIFILRRNCLVPVPILTQTERITRLRATSKQVKLRRAG